MGARLPVRIIISTHMSHVPEIHPCRRAARALLHIKVVHAVKKEKRRIFMPEIILFTLVNPAPFLYAMFILMPTAGLCIRPTKFLSSHSLSILPPAPPPPISLPRGQMNGEGKMWRRGESGGDGLKFSPS